MHDHRFEEPDAIVFEDGAFIEQYRCDHAPITNSWTDDKRDETYYETGPRCERTKQERYDAKVVRYVTESEPDGTVIAKTAGENLFHEVYQSSFEDSEGTSDSADATSDVVESDFTGYWFDFQVFCEELESVMASHLPVEADPYEMEHVTTDEVAVDWTSEGYDVTVWGDETDSWVNGTYVVEYRQ
jgi:hypothetical protein